MVISLVALGVPLGDRGGLNLALMHERIREAPTVLQYTRVAVDFKLTNRVCFLLFGFDGV